MFGKELTFSSVITLLTLIQEEPIYGHSAVSVDELKTVETLLNIKLPKRLEL